MIRLEDLKKGWSRDKELLKGLRPADGLFLSALGARICYSVMHPGLLLWFDERVVLSEERSKFLSRLARAGHYSVFAHSPVNKLVEADYPLALYKSFWFPGVGNVVNCRHLVELGMLQEFLEECKEGSGTLELLWLDEDGTVRVYTYDVSDPVQLPDWFAVYCPAPDSRIGWLSVIVHNVTRIFSHQFVRHTFLSFSQRSHRYTEVHGVRKPEALKDRPGVDAFFGFADALYNDLIRQGVRREDARAVMPQCSLTTVMASAPLPIWEDFVEKRRIKAAQEEIRGVAKFVEALLNYLWEREERVCG